MRRGLPTTPSRIAQQLRFAARLMIAAPTTAAPTTAARLDERGRIAADTARGSRLRRADRRAEMANNAPFISARLAPFRLIASTICKGRFRSAGRQTRVARRAASTRVIKANRRRAISLVGLALDGGCLCRAP